MQLGYNLRKMSTNKSLLTLSRALKTKRDSRETLKRSSGFMMPQQNQKKDSSDSSTSWAPSCLKFCMVGKDEQEFLTPNALRLTPSGELRGNFLPPSLVDGVERRPKRVTTRGSFKCSVPLLSSSLHPPPPSAALSRLQQADLCTVGRGLPDHAEMKKSHPTFLP